MHVLYFHQHFTTPDGAGGTRSYENARALINRGHSVTMVCGRSDRSALDLPWDAGNGWFRGTVDGIDVIALPLEYSNRDGLARRTWIFLRFALRSIGIALRERHDVLFATSTPLTAALPGIVLKLLRPRSRFVFEVRDLWPELPRALGMRNPVLLAGMSLLEWMAYRKADACIGLAPGIVEGIRRRAAVGLRVEMVPNGCDLDLFHPSKRAPLNLPGIAPGDFVAGFTGAHGVANGLDAVLDAAAELKRRGRRGIRLVLVGDGKCKPALVERAKRESLDNVIFFPPVKKTEIARITASFDCGLQILANLPAFYYGTSPNKFFDYLSSGVPVLINYPGWMAELAREHGLGLSVTPSSAVEFADALESLAAETDRAKAMGGAARRTAEHFFGRPRLTEEWVKVLEEAANAVMDLQKATTNHLIS
jgi:glycosyltransferase involved in cell wall biosynthesis